MVLKQGLVMFAANGVLEDDYKESVDKMLDDSRRDEGGQRRVRQLQENHGPLGRTIKSVDIKDFLIAPYKDYDTRYNYFY